MINGTYRFAGKTVEIRSMHRLVHTMSRNYTSPHPAELVIEITPTDIDFERKKSEGPCSDAYLETLAVYRKLAHALLPEDVLLFHASAVAVDGFGYLFTAVSGTGKSTHAGLWRQLFGSRAVMVNDDKPLLKIEEKRVTAFGTPWSGKHALDTNTSVPVRAICILRRAEHNSIREITPYEALPMLLQQSYRPTDQKELVQTLHLVERMSEQAELYELSCNMDVEAARLAYETMSASACDER